MNLIDEKQPRSHIAEEQNTNCAREQSDDYAGSRSHVI